MSLWVLRISKDNMMVSDRRLKLKKPAGCEGQSGEMYCKSPGVNSAAEEGRKEGRKGTSQTRASSVSLGLFSR